MRPIKYSQTLRLQTDPAPSRLMYRLSRLWLRPSSRRLILSGLPTLVLCLLVLLLYRSPSLRADISNAYQQVVSGFTERPELYLQAMQIHGASDDLAQKVRVSAALRFPVGSFEVDLEALRTRIEALDSVEKAEVFIRAGGVIDVNVTERQPVLIWKKGNSFETLDQTGTRVAYIDLRSDYPELAVIAGQGADENTEEALFLYQRLSPIADQIRALRRVGYRRWDVVLADGPVIKLPEQHPEKAIGRLLALEAAKGVLKKDISTIDLRNSDRLTLRMGEASFFAVNQFRKMELEQ